jgi:beta-lactamase class D
LVFVFARALALETSVERDLSAEFGSFSGVFVLYDEPQQRWLRYQPEQSHIRTSPCSTFKVWNSLIGLEEGILTEPDAPFWSWDGEERSFAAWNSDQTWRSAFQASCVPAFQELARKIGADRMQSWLEKLDYGNKDQCGRPDAFWLPRAGQKTVLITPREQARMVCRMIDGKLPVKAESVAKLTEVMKLVNTKRGTLYGKTGSG